jgi:hypothetical protein
MNTDGRSDKTETFTAPIQSKQPGGSVLRDLLTYFRNRRRRAQAWKRYIQAQRLLAIYRSPAAPQWHPDSYRQPGEAE